MKGALDGLRIWQAPDVLEGYETLDDAGIFRVSEDTALVQTLDFFTPVVDDPYAYGAIAAANSLSDVYAMGGRPLTAMNILCVPPDLEMGRLNRILQGAADKLKEAECSLVGGHSVRDRELKFGCSVTGVVHPKKFWSNATARPGDRLVLTKPIGSGILTSALKGGRLSAESIERVTAVMTALNRGACEAAIRAGGVSAATDVTGFGLVGHLCGMGRASQATVRIEAKRVPLMAEVLDFAMKGIRTSGDKANRDYVEGHYQNRGVDELLEAVLMDPQTSGGLVLAVEAGRVDAMVAELRRAGTLCAEVIGGVEAHRDNLHVVIE